MTHFCRDMMPQTMKPMPTIPPTIHRAWSGVNFHGTSFPEIWREQKCYTCYSVEDEIRHSSEWVVVCVQQFLFFFNAERGCKPGRPCGVMYVSSSLSPCGTPARRRRGGFQLGGSPGPDGGPDHVTKRTFFFFFLESGKLWDPHR